MQSTHQNMPLTPVTIKPRAIAGGIACRRFEIRKQPKIAENCKINLPYMKLFVGFLAHMDSIFHSRHQFSTLWECV